MLDGEVRLSAAKGPHRSAGIPTHCQIRIENEGPVDERDSPVEMAHDVTQGEATERKRDRVILVQGRRPPSQPRGIGDLLRAIDRPAVDLANDVAECRHAMGRSKIRVELDGLGEQLQRFGGGLAGHLMRAGHPAQKVVISVQTFGGLALRSFDLGPLQLGRDRPDNARGDLILQIEDVLAIAIEMICPQMRAGRSIDQLRRDPHAVPGLANAAFNDVAHAQLATHLLHIHRPPLVDEARIARDHEQPAHVADAPW